MRQGNAKICSFACRKNSVLCSSIEVEEFLNCDVAAWFWVSWRNGEIVIGNGSNVGTESLMIFGDKNPIAINYAAISSPANDTVEWVIPGQYYGTCLSLLFSLLLRTSLSLFFLVLIKRCSS